jgi:adenine deaminase
LKKIEDALSLGKIVNGHAPLVTGKDIDRYISVGIGDDHECSSAEEGKERIRKGQWVMIRQGTAARNLADLLPLFDDPWCHRCLLVTDDKHPADLLTEGHIDGIIREAVKLGKSAVTAIQMATIGAAQRFGRSDVGAVAPGYKADLLVLDDMQSVSVRDVYRHGEKVVSDGALLPFEAASVSSELMETVRNSFHVDPLKASDFMIRAEGEKCRVIRVIPKQLLTEEWITEIDFNKNNGVDTDRDILKLAVIERHHRTGHMGLGFIHGLGLKKGALAASVSHDSHNLIVIGTSEEDMALAANRVREMNGGNAVVSDGKVLSEMPLPIAGLMSDLPADKVAAQNHAVRAAVYELGVADGVEPFMNMAFISLSVIPHLKMTTKGLLDVDTQEIVSLFV